MVEWVRGYIAKVHHKDGLTILDNRMRHLMALGFVGNVRLPSMKHLWESPSTLQANEYTGLMQVISMKICNETSMFTVKSGFQVAPVLLRKLVPVNILHCFIDMWQWYVIAV